jgi:hypothetical protein
MKRRGLIGFAAPSLLVLMWALAPRLEPAPKLRVVDLEGGTPYHMGLVHGRALRGEIRELVKRWKRDLEKTYGVPADDVIAEFLKKTDFKPAITRWTPGLLDEVRGIIYKNFLFALGMRSPAANPESTFPSTTKRIFRPARLSMSRN